MSEETEYEFAATLVSEGAPLVGRTVSFRVNGVTHSSRLTDASGVARFEVTFDRPMTVTVDAIFTGEATYASAVSESYLIAVLELVVPTTLDITGPDVITEDTDVEFAAHLAHWEYSDALDLLIPVAIPGAEIAFNVDGALVGTAVTDSTGTARLLLQFPEPGAHSISANFDGMVTFL